MQNLKKNFSNVSVLVVGDVMLDQYWWGTVDRISPEAPVPIVHLNKKNVLAGGAANVAANIAGLGAKTILIGAIGNDIEAEIFNETLNSVNVSPDHLIKTNRSTTIKTRIIAQTQQIVRIDQENIEPISVEEEKLFWQQIESNIDETDIVLISDYAKGAVTENLAKRLISLAKKKNKLIIVDPKGKNYSKYKSATVITPNILEAMIASNAEFKEETSIAESGNKLLNDLDLEGLIITRGEKGMTLFQKGKELINLNASARKVFDVTGAGDTVIATLTVAIGAGMDFYTAANLANIAAGIVVERVGTSAITFDDLEKAVSSQ